LGTQRLHPAFGVGSPDAKVMFIGEGPGFEEDRQGEPFVGKAGQLLDKILASIGLSRKTVYIANIVKCHPMVDPADPERRGNDRPPTPAEMEACRGFLDEQIRLIRPRWIVTLGGVAAKTLIATETGITRLRGKWHTYEPLDIPLLPTYHPAALLRNPDWKRDVWTDMKNLKNALERDDEANA
jgi:DNA polymerase